MSCLTYILLSLIFLNVYETSEWTLVADEACFSATDFAIDYEFNPPRSGNVTAVKLNHLSGGITCSNSAIDNVTTNWGCSTDNHSQVQLVWEFPVGKSLHLYTVLPTKNTQNVIELMTFWNNADNGTYWFQDALSSSWCTIDDGCSVYKYWMDGNSLWNEELIWNDSALNYYVSRNDTFSLQYGEGCCGVTITGNEGVSCAEVYFQFAGMLIFSDISTSFYPNILTLLFT